jgi:hypothetical protein
MTTLPIMTPTPKPSTPSSLRILKNVMASAAEVEIAATFMNGQGGCPNLNYLVEWKLPTLPTL